MCNVYLLRKIVMIMMQKEKYKFNVIYGKIWVQNTLEMSKALFSK